MPLHSINVHDRKEEFKPTTEELKIIGDKMKDPEFVKLMHEYMQSLEDPETRKEEEAYLEQMEKEAKEGGDYSFDFVFPKASFVIQLQQTPGEKQPVYVNMCTSDKVDEFREETTNNRMGSNWHVPVAVSQSRDEQFEGSTVTVYDAAFHPKTLELSFRSNRFLCFLAEIVVENINQGYQKRYGFEFNRLGSNVVSIGVPKNQTIRRKNGEAAFPVSPEPVSRGPIRPPPASHKDPASAPQTAAAPPPPPPAAATAPTASTKPSGPTLPVFQIAHRGEIDLSDAWNWKVVDKRIGIPKELVVRIELPGVTSAAHLDLDIADGYLELARSTHHRFGGTIPLPFTVDATPKSAKFDKSKQQLTLTLSVIPPSMPEDVRAFHDERKAQQQTTTTTTTDGSDETAEANKEVSVGESSVAAAAVSSSSLSTSDSTIPPAASVDPAAATTTTPSVPPPPSEVDTPTTAPPPPVANPQLTHLEPNDRVAAMMAKLEEARKERERSEAEEKAKEEAAAAAAASATPPPPPPAAAPLVSEDAPEVIDLRKQQLEWKRAIEEEQTARAKAAAEAEAAEAEKAAEALRKAEREVQKQKRLQREAEALEEALRKKMEELPLKSHYIFDIQ